VVAAAGHHKVAVGYHIRAAAVAAVAALVGMHSAVELTEVVDIVAERLRMVVEEIRHMVVA